MPLVAGLLALIAVSQAHHAGQYSTAWRLRIEPRFGTVPVRRIKPSHIDDWLADMNQDGVSPVSWAGP